MISVPFDRPKAVATEPELWKMAQSELGRFGVLDFYMIKPEGEVLATGSCFSGANPKQESYVRVAVRTADQTDKDKPFIDRRLMVYGNRKWGVSGMTPPEPFTEMRVDYSRAFGGEKDDRNPIGRGLGPIEEDGANVYPLPNVEDPRHLVRSKGDRPPPASPGPMDPTWPANFKKIGTYDFDYAKKHAPGFADDIDFGMFNVAVPEQRLSGKFWNGDERIRVENMHPEKPVLEMQLPSFIARTFVRTVAQHAKTDAEKDLAEVQMRLDTVHLFPARERAVLVYRGLREIHTADATDVDTVLIALEDRDGERRPLDHYRTSFDNRADREKLATYALYDKDLMPESAISGVGALSTGDRLDEVTKPEGLMQQNLERKRYREMTQAREQMIEAGADPALVPEPPPPAPPLQATTMDDLPTVMEEAFKKVELAKQESERRKVEAEAHLRELCRENGQDYEAVRAQARRNASGPPKFSAAAELEKLRDMWTLGQNAEADTSDIEEKLESEEFRAQLENAEQQLVDAYRLTAHDNEPAEAMSEEETKVARDELAMKVRGAPIDRRDFTGADLRGLDLSNADLSNGFFESANLSGANLAGAKLERAVFAHANLEGADLSGAKLKDANIGRAKLKGAKLAGADLSEATFVGADLSGADLTNLKLDGASIRDVRFDGANLDGLRGSQVTLMKCQLVGATMRGAALKLTTFIDCDVDDADFSGSELDETAFFMCRGRGAKFNDSKLPNLRIVHECDFERAVFARSEMRQTNLRATKLAGSDFSDCDLSQSDISSADFSDGNLFRVILREALMLDTNFSRANLRGANMMQVIAHRVIVRGADVSKANLFASDLSHAVGDNKTSFSGSNLKRVFAAGGFVG
jgi:uncharacterized protein YjbI with pentapeptide repeats